MNNVIQDIVRYLKQTGPFLMFENRQVSLADTTPERLLETGSFGIGGPALTATNVGAAPLGSVVQRTLLDTEAVAAGLPALANPATATQRSWTVWTAGDATYRTQVATEALGTNTRAGRMFARGYNGTTWSVWQEVGVGYLPSFTSASRPSASSLGRGATIYDETLQKPLYSNGTQWRSAEGEVAS